ncbi:hypothetical protein [Stenotrophomonas maltophilia]|uniref:hypothetical protein n=1 Tax=Stenotrophomonas maltophilia TaxID=40324 RepID=UPI000F65A987|nr:hypothetical protein [Stenotrophomonas maltophilia]RRU74129.1 hypothetical protein EGJ89_07355 [Stenotrophomonas maltophilia]
MITVAVTMMLAAAAGDPTEELKQCRAALRYCAAAGPVAANLSGSRGYGAADAAAVELADAARRLARCAERGDLNDDCYREARRVKSAADDYQTAAEEHQRREH